MDTELKLMMFKCSRVHCLRDPVNGHWRAALFSSWWLCTKLSPVHRDQSWISIIINVKLTLYSQTFAPICKEGFFPMFQVIFFLFLSFSQEMFAFFRFKFQISLFQQTQKKNQKRFIRWIRKMRRSVNENPSGLWGSPNESQDIM